MSNVNQRTFYIDDKKIQIKSIPKTKLGNLLGWVVFVNGKKMFVNKLVVFPTSQERRVAEDIAYARFVDSLPTPEAIENCTCKKNIICNYCAAAKQDYYRI
tara:strand:+ start:60 stop:362 length:303 start_codon:yes stop_codon:yes gene_type:complete